MKLKMRNISNLDTFFKVINQCDGAVELSLSGRRKRKLKVQTQPVLFHGYRFFQRKHQGVKPYHTQR